MKFQPRQIAGLQSLSSTSSPGAGLPSLKAWLHCVPSPTGLLRSALTKVALAAVFLLIAGGVQAASIYGSTTGSLYSVDVDTGATTFLSPLTGIGAGFNLAAGAPGTLYSTSSSGRLFEHDLGTNITTETAASGVAPGNALGSNVGVLLSGSGSSLFSIDPLTGASSLIGSGAASYAGDIVTDLGGLVYGATTGQNLVTIDTLTAAQTVVGVVGLNLFGLALSEDGRLWGIEGGTGNIHEINKTTGASSFAFDSGVAFTDLASNPNLIPEPSTALLLGIGLAGMAARRGGRPSCPTRQGHAGRAFGEGAGGTRPHPQRAEKARCTGPGL